MLTNKTFVVKETKIINTPKEFQVVENGTLLKCIKAYNKFKVGEIVLVHDSFLHSESDTGIAHDVCWWYKDSNIRNKRTIVVNRDVVLLPENFVETDSCELKKYIQE